VGHRAGLDAVVKRKFPSLCWDCEPPTTYQFKEITALMLLKSNNVKPVPNDRIYPHGLFMSVLYICSLHNMADV
jgi:hypothetical protein